MVKAKKHLGQHFLIDKNIASKIADSLLNENNCDVLEIGPGTGVLTQFLVQKPYKLSLVEIDKESVDYLNENYNGQFTLWHEDFLKMNLQDYFDAQFCIIGNFPYNISSQIFFKLLENRENIPELVGMIQKEVAERIASVHGNKIYGILSVLLQLYYKTEYLFTVNENVFVPPPKVKSAVIRFTRITTDYDDLEFKKLKLVVKTAFNQRRKTMRNSLKSILPEHVDTTDEIFNKRPEQLSPPEFLELTKMIFR
ncbi:MAG: 16S rRNA (adenine(1518)-N(6)/adenine(1519)-N(6))-dimethyltransferase RsmA [Bacteroidales bacterium]|nr:16S rRNA (adenine(1518)-N(6)/adenine(1519)-N(6))-dimethyltransferase RsmA [Bacteroidales bacterium]